MSVAQQLGLHSQDSELLQQARRQWTGWSRGHPALAEAGGIDGLPAWLATADPARADDVLHALATLGSPFGDDEIPAAGALAWALLPGACALAHRLRTLSPQIDELVASQLWLEVRSFPWQRLRKVAANVLGNTRAGVLRECGARTQVARADPMWSAVRPIDPTAPLWDRFAVEQVEQVAAADELLEVLAWACAQRVISDTDRALLLSLLAAAEESGTTRTGRGSAGLMSNTTSAAVAVQWDISAVTVRRRARRTIDALTAARADFLAAA